MPRFREIKQYVPDGSYAVDVSWNYLEEHVKKYVEDYNLEVNPDFQRGHVWTEDQQIAFIEFSLRGGKGASDLRFNCDNWMRKNNLRPMVLVDGLQRLTATLRFLHNEIRAFGYHLDEYEDKLPMMEPAFRVHVNGLATRLEVLEWYIQLNSGGTPHAASEIDRVNMMWLAEKHGRSNVK